eukprot:1868685-Pyramimonas_sp.AAC.2
MVGGVSLVRSKKHWFCRASFETEMTSKRDLKFRRPPGCECTLAVIGLGGLYKYQGLSLEGIVESPTVFSIR